MFIIILVITSCATQSIITQGEHGYVGPLNEEYDIFQLEDVSAANSSFLGLSTGNNNKEGIIVNFFGYSNQEKIDNPTKNIVSLMSLISCAYIGSQITKEEPISSGLLGGIGGILVGGAINELAFSNRTKINASIIASRKLIEKNPNIDLFVYPKYNISSYSSLFSSKSNITISSKGAKLKNEIIKNNNVLITDDKPSRPLELEELKNNKVLITNEQSSNNELEQHLMCQCNYFLKQNLSPMPEDCQKLFLNYKFGSESGKAKWAEDLLWHGCEE